MSLQILCKLNFYSRYQFWILISSQIYLLASTTFILLGILTSNRNFAAF